MSVRRALLLSCCTLVLVLVGRVARGEDTQHDKQLATDLFDRGVRKMRDGRCDQTPLGQRDVCEQARDDFERAYALYPAGLGALRNLAYVELSLGQLASAARHFRELARRAPLDPDPARKLWADFARQEAEGLQARIPRLTVQLAERPPGVQVELDGHALPEAAWDTALEVDPGEHTVQARAPGHSPFEVTLAVQERERKDVLVALQQSRVSTLAPARSRPPVREEHAAPRRRILPLIVSGLGVATLTTGLGLGYVAIEKRKDACGDSRYCDPEALASGRSVARASTFVTAAGAALTAGGLVWYFLTPSSTQGVRASLRPLLGSAAGVETVGSF